MKNILCFGDSNTFGWDPASQSRLTQYLRWPGVLAVKLGAGYHIVEEGCGGRTTVMDDGIETFVSGVRYLEPCLRSHTPLDVVVIMLGTNDLKIRYALSPQDIANGMGILCSAVQTVLRFEQETPPRILVVSPIHIGEGIDAIPDAYEMFGAAAREKSLRLAGVYQSTARRYGCDFFDAAKAAEPSPLDCIHLDADGHEALGRAISVKILEMLN